MKKDKPTPMTNQQLSHLTVRTYQWCQGVLLQGKRFLDVFDQTHGTTLWDKNENSSLLCADRLFLITALHHAIVCLERLNWELQQQNDLSFQSVLDAIATSGERKQIIKLRNMNEHGLDYLTGNGVSQNSFASTVEKNSYRIQTNAFWTVVHGDAGLFLMGDVEIDKLLLRFKDNLPAIKAKTEEVFVSLLASS